MADKSEATVDFNYQEIVRHFRRVNSGMYSNEHSFQRMMDEREARRREQSEDPINRPKHYTAGGIEPIDFIESHDLGFHLGNVVKYITRAKHKGAELTDLKKARWYLDRKIQRLEGTES